VVYSSKLLNGLILLNSELRGHLYGIIDFTRAAMLDWKGPWPGEETDRVEFGTVSGDYVIFPQGHPLGSKELRAPLLAINTVLNSEEGNGHFAEYLSLLKQHCASKGWDLGFLDVVDWLKGRLMEKRGFVELSGSIHIICYCAEKAPG
jgi:hypothetical protein